MFRMFEHLVAYDVVPRIIFETSFFGINCRNICYDNINIFTNIV